MPDDPSAWIGLGLVGLFVAAFLAGSAFPFPSEPVLVGLLQAGASPTWSVVVATAGNVAGAVTIYLIGLGVVRGKRRLWDPPDEAEQARGEAWVQRLGAGALLLSWAPIVGDPIVFAAALAGVRWGPFLALVTLAKLGRYVVLALLTLELLG